jgi:hypothetical protein
VTRYNSSNINISFSNLEKEEHGSYLWLCLGYLFRIRKKISLFLSEKEEWLVNLIRKRTKLALSYLIK